jgi:D-lyxose ketol-isomerase
MARMHRHNLKTEDIINKGGGTLVLELFKANADGSGSTENAEVNTLLTDGLARPPAGRAVT